jgi:uncharacterized damage-inducible protein DinB
MSKSLLEDAFGHHVWATLCLIDACLPLSPEQLETEVLGTYGSILATMRHTVGGDVSYLYALTEGRTAEIDDERMDLAELRIAMERNGVAWSEFLAEGPDPEADRVRHRDDGTDSHAPISIRLAQALQHGTDHRSQICTVLTTLGVQPPNIDVWDFGRLDGRVVVVPAAS